MEGRIKEIQKAQDSYKKHDEAIRDNSRDIIGLEEDVEKLKRQLNNLEEKVNKGNNKKLTKNEKALFEQHENDLASLKKRLDEQETTVDHLNNVTFEDFGRRFKKEIFENTDSQITKLTKNVELLGGQVETHKRMNNNLDNNLLNLRKKLDEEMLKMKDLELIKLNESKWKNNESQLEKIESRLDEILKKSLRHDKDISDLSQEVHSYAFNEMASDFNDRVNLKLEPLKQQIEDVTKKIANSPPRNEEDISLKNFLKEVEKIIDDKIGAHNKDMNEKLLKLEECHPGPNSPKKEEPRILYQNGNQIIDPKFVMTTPAGILRFRKKCHFDSRCQKISCEFLHDTETCPAINCIDPECPLRHPKSPRHSDYDQKLHKSHSRMRNPNFRNHGAYKTEPNRGYHRQQNYHIRKPSRIQQKNQEPRNKHGDKHTDSQQQFIKQITKAIKNSTKLLSDRVSKLENRAEYPICMGRGNPYLHPY